MKESGEIFALYEKYCEIRGKENIFLFINITQHIFLQKEHEEKYTVIVIDLNLTKIQKKKLNKKSELANDANSGL